MPRTLEEEKQTKRAGGISLLGICALWIPVLCAATTHACSFDSDVLGPYVPPPIPQDQGACRSTEALFPRLLAFVRQDRLSPLRGFLERRLLPGEGRPMPNTSLRTLLGTLARLARELGLERAHVVAGIVARNEVQSNIAPLLVTVLKFTDGRIDFVPRYDSSAALEHFVRSCNLDHMLTAIEQVLVLESPSQQMPWIQAVLGGIGDLTGDPALRPFLASFERESLRGRLAIISLLAQMMAFVADDAFALRRVETLLESAVYPNVRPELRAKIEHLALLVDEATSDRAGIFLPLQRAVRCGMASPPERDELLGFLYDLIASEAVALDSVIGGVTGAISSGGSKAELALAANLVRTIREDRKTRDEIRELVALMLSIDEAPILVPLWIDLIEEGVVRELLDGLVALLNGCGRA